jgi:magnesium transporter
VIDYGPGVHEERRFSSVDDALEHARPEGAAVRWINVDGLDAGVVDRLRHEFHLHTLAAEDIINTRQRPKLDLYEDHLFLVLRQFWRKDGGHREEQISVLCRSGLLITLQEEPGDIFDPLRQRLQRENSRFRRFGSEYLLYALIDSIVDHVFPITEGIAQRMEEVEEAIAADPVPEIQTRIFSMRREISLLRRAVWPMREVVDGLLRDESARIPEELLPFFRDVLDHAVQAVEVMEAQREALTSLADFYQSSLGNRMNEVMKVLTVMASFFIPVTFLAGIYGMNFEGMPELQWRYGYAAFWVLCIGMISSLWIYFRKKGWLR